jgi:cysteinyl-tRNA synthetase
MSIKIFNSLTQKKEKLPEKKEFKLFVCGPTVYDLTHIGHARTYLFFDFFAKFLKTQGYKVFYVQNITDVDDKIINKAKNQNINPLKLSKNLTKKYLADMKSLNINSVNIYAPATKFIPQIISQVKRLIQKNYAYKTNDGYYFNIQKFKDYGKLSKRTATQAEDAVSRIDESIKKINKGDFCLWKFPEEEKQNLLEKFHKGKKFIILDFEPLWNTELGWGRPGWHIEDTAIAEYYLGLQYDLHGGGVDLKFPHHEAEIAQAESLSGKKPFVKIWMHTGQLLVNGQKMSKSLGNFITIKDFLKEYKAIVLKFLFLMHHWRSPINYEEKNIALTLNNLQKIYETNEKIKFALNQKKFGIKNISILKINSLAKKFNNALKDDINTPLALAYFFEIINLINQNLFELNKKSIQNIYKIFKKCLNMLDLKIPEPKIPLKIKAVLSQREKLRINKQFMQSDILRNKINNLGYKLEDTPLGAIVFYKNLWIQK